MNSYSYTKTRREFGRPINLSDYHAELFNQDPDEELKRQFIRRNPLEISVQNAPEMSHAEINTINTQFSHMGMKHLEGGWPNEVSIADEEQVLRYQKRIMRTEEWEVQLKRISVRMIRKVRQNFDLLQEYFADDKTQVCGSVDVPCIDSIKFFEFPGKSSNCYVIANHSSVSPRSTEEVFISYSNENEATPTVSHIWNINFTHEPLSTFECGASIKRAEFNVKDGFIVAAGRSDGIVSIYDTRKDGKPQIESLKETSHRGAVSSLLWIHSKSNCEFFTGSTLDGMIMWWDTRKMNNPYESFKLGNSENENKHQVGIIGCTTLEYTYSMPSRFMIGTNTGLIISGNKRGVTHAERFPYSMKTANGIVRTIERNPFSENIFLAVGDYCIRFWADDNRDTYIMQSEEQSDLLSCAAWSKNRAPTFFVGRADGKIDLWDFLHSHKQPAASIKKTGAVNHISTHPNGELFVSCHSNGDVHLMKVSDCFVMNRGNDRQKLQEMFERESIRENLFQNKLKEMQRISSGIREKEPAPEYVAADCIKEFNNIINDEIRNK